MELPLKQAFRLQGLHLLLLHPTQSNSPAFGKLNAPNHPNPRTLHTQPLLQSGLGHTFSARLRSTARASTVRAQDFLGSWVKCGRVLDFQDLGQRAQGWALRVWDSRFEVIWSREWDKAKRENYGGIATELYSYASNVGVLVAFVAEL